MSDAPSSTVYRVDKFVVPAASLYEFLARANAARELLSQQAGFIRSTFLEQFAGPGEFNIVAIAEWRDQACAEDAKAAISAFSQKTNLEPQDVFQRRHGIKSDLGFYKEVGV